MTETVLRWYDREYSGGTTVQKKYYGGMRVLWWYDRHGIAIVCDREYWGGMTKTVLYWYVRDNNYCGGMTA